MPDRPPLRDIGFRPLPTLDWADAQREVSIGRLIEYVSHEAQEIISWYLRKKEKKRLGARGTRLFAVLATAAAAVIPLVAQIYPRSIQPGWASIALVLAAAGIGIDRFFGYSSAWIRYLATEMQIRQALHRFHLAVEAKRAELAGTTPDIDDTQYLLSLCTELLLGLHDAVRDETAAWSSELRAVLREMEDAARLHAQEQRSGEVRLTVTNGDQTTSGWTATVDAGPAETHTGRTATLRNVAPGRRLVQIRGTIAGQQKTARKTVTVTAGGSTAVELAFP
jgi:SMODS and SLOG-associating 2TM effector domain 2